MKRKFQKYIIIFIFFIIACICIDDLYFSYKLSKGQYPYIPRTLQRMHPKLYQETLIERERKDKARKRYSEININWQSPFIYIEDGILNNR